MEELKISKKTIEEGAKEYNLSIKEMENLITDLFGELNLCFDDIKAEDNRISCTPFVDSIIRQILFHYKVQPTNKNIAKFLSLIFITVNNNREYFEKYYSIEEE